MPSRPPRAAERTLAAAADAVLPRGGPFPEGGDDLDVAGALAQAWPDMPVQGRRTVLAMVAAVDAAALLRTGRRLHRLDTDRRVRLCDALEHRAGPLTRSAWLGLKTLVLVLAASDPRLQERLGARGWPPQLLHG